MDINWHLFMEQQIQWDEKTNKTLLITKFDDGSLLCEPITSEEAAQKEAEMRY